ncbi:alpha/beta hydrolase [Actinoplanes sp. DH11]|uniref:RBBP9/YdeN family alpha/beta hydrolase n=1 Tax=Actinoplanes sp. DH11 TaxID=2857011 RepID=UPI001E49FC26|nr:alpha/beta hydrolase [Actinoplanes sp. DH11]
MRFLLVPGRGVPYPEHWSWQWARTLPGCAWAPEPPGPPYLAGERVAALHAALTADDEPAVLIAHSAGCLTVAHWAARHTGPVRAALLVTPPFVGDEAPHDPLPMRSVVVASRTDPHATFAQATRMAADWGAQLYDAGPVGHLDSKTGFGPWPDGERLLRELAHRGAEA